jgi:hypothetical protein
VILSLESQEEVFVQVDFGRGQVFIGRVQLKIVVEVGLILLRLLCLVEDRIISDVAISGYPEEQEVLFVHLGYLGWVWEEDLEGSCVILQAHQFPLHVKGLLGIGFLDPHPRNEVAIELRKHLLCLPSVEYELIEFDSEQSIPIDPDGYHTHHPFEPALVPLYLC